MDSNCRRNRLAWRILAGTLLLALPSGAQTLAGRVVDSAGAPVEGATVRFDGVSALLVTDARGAFELVIQAPLALEVEHPGFAVERVELRALPAGELVVRLRNRRVVREEIAVSASRSQGGYAPQSVAVSTLAVQASALEPRAVGDLVVEAPGVSQNGQGGLFQTYSVRGVSRQRVLTLVEGVRIVGERRAGVSASFLDPLLLGSVEVVRGPSSTYWGSGALGGVVQLFARRFSGLSVVSGYGSQGSERYARIGIGRESSASGWSWGIAGRAADSSETPAGEELRSGFEQFSTVWTRSWSSGRTDYRALFAASRGNDIGKSSIDFPDRVTTYPSETHGVVHLQASRARGWRFEAFAHPNQLETRVERGGGEASEVQNRAFDWGVDLQREVELPGRTTGRWGVDVFVRDNVTARERTRAPNAAIVVEEETLSNASEIELGVYGAVEKGFTGSGVTLLAGGRLAHQRQSNALEAGSDDSAVTGFAGLVAPLGRGYELTANLGTGLRFPSVSERFFSGTTGRGRVEGNANLDAESSLSADIGLRWTAGPVYLAASAFRSEIDDYIERVEEAPGLLTFVNLTSGRVEGFELEGAWHATDAASLSFGAHAIAGADRGGRPLADVPADRVWAGWALESARSRGWAWSGRWERRASKNDVGSGEKPIPAADLVTASLRWRLRSNLAIRVSARNLLDRAYFASADDKAPLSPGRSLSVSMSWTAGAPSSW